MKIVHNHLNQIIFLHFYRVLFTILLEIIVSLKIYEIFSESEARQGLPEREAVEGDAPSGAVREAD